MILIYQCIMRFRKGMYIIYGFDVLNILLAITKMPSKLLIYIYIYIYNNNYYYYYIGSFGSVTTLDFCCLK